MPTEATKLKILNSALRMVGSFHIDADDETSSTYEIATRAFSQAVTEVFGDNIFSYNTKSVELTAGNSTANTTEPYQYYYNLPSDFNILLKICHPTDHYNITDYSFYNGLFHCNDPVVDIYYTYVPDLSSAATTLPAFLTRLLTLHMAQNMTIELSGSENRHEILFKQYTLALRRARVLEGRSSPAQRYITDGSSSFIQAHCNYGKV
tara:strand:- start:10990 stop:11610 length:621 start_codon:yes stop_codon:yes gene_type:complete